MPNIHDDVYYGKSDTPESTLASMAESMIELRRLKDETENKAKKINDDIDKLEREMFAEMMTAEMDSFAAYGYSFTPTVKALASIPAEVRDEAFEALEENGHGGLIKREVNTMTFRSFYRDILDADGNPPEWLAPYVSVYNKETISVRKRG